MAPTVALASAGNGFASTATAVTPAFVIASYFNAPSSGYGATSTAGTADAGTGAPSFASAAGTGKALRYLATASTSVFSEFAEFNVPVVAGTCYTGVYATFLVGSDRGTVTYQASYFVGTPPTFTNGASAGSSSNTPTGTGGSSATVAGVGTVAWVFAGTGAVSSVGWTPVTVRLPNVGCATPSTVVQVRVDIRDTTVAACSAPTTVCTASCSASCLGTGQCVSGKSCFNNPTASYTCLLISFSCCSTQVQGCSTLTGAYTYLDEVKFFASTSVATAAAAPSQTPWPRTARQST